MLPKCVVFGPRRRKRKPGRKTTKPNQELSLDTLGRRSKRNNRKNACNKPVPGGQSGQCYEMNQETINQGRDLAEPREWNMSVDGYGQLWGPTYGLMEGYWPVTVREVTADALKRDLEKPPLAWTTERPTKEGRYVCCQSDGSNPDIFRLSGGEFAIWCQISWEPMWDAEIEPSWIWLGPLPEPGKEGR